MDKSTLPLGIIILPSFMEPFPHPDILLPIVEPPDMSHLPFIMLFSCIGIEPLPCMESAYA
ncbi:hypothetical protein [Candidatus Nitrosotalea sp. TS]|uniref:hypothetical protein n=1 Tax=Candidatus Nitrosotalea sp. TS TaxID=2341020 RepID=UPI001C49C494|nr:hypothetical protein [Candidatus Nitrosotalea sp. TS]